MSRLLKILILTVLIASCVSASEVSYVGVAPINKPTETGIGLVWSAVGGAISFDTANMALELYYRKNDVETFDMGISIADLPLSSLPGTPDIIFDLKIRLIRGKNIIPSIALGVNMIRFNDIDFSDLALSPVFLDEGRIGFSWEFQRYAEKGELVSDIVYTGVNVIPGSSSLGNRYFFGAKFGNLNLILVIQNDIDSISLGYSW